MEAQPHYYPPQKKNKTGLIIGLVLGGVALCCLLGVGAMAGFGYWGFNLAKPIAQCAFTMSDARDAVKRYATEHDGKLPNAATWQDDVRGYYAELASSQKDRGPFQTSPPQGLWGCEGGTYGRTGIAYNDAIAGKKSSEVSSEVILYEIEKAEMNAHGDYSKAERNEANSPKIMNENRGWFQVTLDGEPDLMTKGKLTPVNMKGGKFK